MTVTSTSQNFNTLAEFFDPVGANVNDWPEADFDQNNLVDLTDFNFLATNYAPDGYLWAGRSRPGARIMAARAWHADCGSGGTAACHRPWSPIINWAALH